MRAYRLTFIALLGMIFIVIIGTLGFKYFEDISLFEALWMTVITVLTVGYGDYTPVTIHGKIFALIIIPFGISLVAYALGTLTAALIEGELSKTFGRKRMERNIKKLEKHYILCGYGRVGQQVALQLLREGVPIVIIEKNKEVIERLPEHALHIEGDATEDAVLIQAGIEKSMGIITALPMDADNVMISLTAKGLNPNIQVVSRAEKIESEEKLRRAGADKVINPSSIGGRRMALSIIKPISVDYVDTILQSHTEEYRIEDVRMQGTSKILGESVKNTKVREKYGVTIVAIKRDNDIISNPNPEEVLLVNDILIVFGTTSQLHRFEEDLK